MAVALDGTRIGKPGLEVVLMPATDLVNLRHCVLPPQAWDAESHSEFFSGTPIPPTAGDEPEV